MGVLTTPQVYRSKSGIYHVIMRGINRQRIFEDDETEKGDKFPVILSLID